MLTAIDPSSGQVLREVESASDAQVEAIIKAAGEAYDSWRERSFSERAQVLRAVASLMREDVENLALPMVQEMGKPIREARGEVLKSAWCAEHYADQAERYLASEVVASDASRSYVQYRPLGVVLGILPWNAPFWLAFRFGAPTLMAGNVCVMKHDPHVPACAQSIADLFVRAGAPEGVFQNLPLETVRVEPVIRDPRVRGVSFTGSSRAGAIVASVAASEIKPAVLELGGSDPVIVLEDAELEQAADAITLSRIINAGQSCIAAKRILAHTAVHDRLVALLEERLARLRLGDPRDEQTDIGPLARGDLRDNLHSQVQRTIAAGATCRLGGVVPEGPGFFYPATLLTEVTNSMPAACEETFGPVACVIRVESEAEAIALANDTSYGLAASVWTEAARGEAIASTIESGQVVVNGVVKTDPRLPSGGIKGSGYGRELGRHGIHSFVNAQQIWIGPKQG